MGKGRFARVRSIHIHLTHSFLFRFGLLVCFNLVQTPTIVSSLSHSPLTIFPYFIYTPSHIYRRKLAKIARLSFVHSFESQDLLHSLRFSSISVQFPRGLITLLSLPIAQFYTDRGTRNCNHNHNHATSVQVDHNDQSNLSPTKTNHWYLES